MAGDNGQPPTSTQLTSAEPFTPDAESEYRLDKKYRAKLHEIIGREIQRVAEMPSAETMQTAADQALHKADSIWRRMSNRILRVVRRVRLFASMLRDTATDNFGAPVYTVAGLVFALMYFTAPADMIPDLLPMIGLADDAFVLSVVGNLFRRDLDRYIAWKKLNPADFFADASTIIGVRKSRDSQRP